MTSRKRCSSPTASSCSATGRRASRPTSRSIVPIRGTAAIPDWRSCAATFLACSDWTRHGERDQQFDPQGASGWTQRPCLTIARGCLLPNSRRARRSTIATRSFPFENFKELAEAGLLALTVPTALGGHGAGALDTARILGIFGKADPSTALVLSMHYIQHLVMARSTRWPGRLSRKLARESGRRRGADQCAAGRA